jgi:hypothetical protein
VALTIKDIVAASYPAVLAEARKPHNQWADSSLLSTMEKMGFVKHVSLGPTIEVPLDYVSNSAGEFLATDITATALTKTSVIGAASYAVAEVSVPIVWTKKDEATNPSANQKIAYVKALLTNGIDTHDGLVETALLAATATQGFNSLPVLATEDGTGTVGGIIAGTDTMWKNTFYDYGDTITLALVQAGLTAVYNGCSKGSVTTSRPTLCVTSSTQHASYEGLLTPLQRFEGSSASGAFKSIMFKDVPMIFSSKYTSDSYFFMSPKSLQLIVSKEYFRNRGETSEVNAAHAFVTKLYSALQLVTPKRSALGVAFT